MPQRDDLETKTKLLREATERLVVASRDGSLKAPHIVEIYAGLVAEMGGVDLLTSMWAQDIKLRREYLARIKKAPDKTLFDQYSAIFKMGAAVSDQAMKAAEQMSDAELKRELMALLAREVEAQMVLDAEALPC